MDGLKENNITNHIFAGNYAYGILNAPITTGSTAITFTTSVGTSFPVLSATSLHPQQYFYLTLVDALTQGVVTREIVKVVGPSAATTGVITYTIIRAQEGTTAHAFAAGDGVQLRETQQTLFDYAAQGAPAGWFNVVDFGAVHDGVTNDTAAIQAAIEAAFQSKGGVVYFEAGNYYTTGTLDLKDNVQLIGQGGPTGAWGAAGGLTVRGVTISITNLVSTFINISGRGCSIKNMIFYWPNQALPTALAPIAYPYCITSPVGDTVLEGLTMVNCTHGIALENGPQYLENLRIGAFNIGILMDQGGATQTLRNIQIGAGLQDQWLGYAFGSNLDIYTATNLVCVDIRRSDAFCIDNLVTFYSKVGISITDSVVISPPTAYGNISNIDLEAPLYGIICQQTNSYLAAGGIKISNMNMFGSAQPGPFPPSVYGIWMKAGGSVPPFLEIVNGFIGNTWSGPYIQYDAGTLILNQVYNGDYPAANVTAPAVPASTVTALNPYPYRVAVYITGGTYTAVSVNGGASLGTPSTVMLPANATIAITYSVSPSWVWTK